MVEEYKIKAADLVEIADVIREKGNTIEELVWPEGWKNAIQDLSSLNFEVVGGITQPENPKENTIWVNTSTAITGWEFSSTQPILPVDGMVWIKAVLYGANFNALTDNAITLHLANANQYINGNWVSVDGLIYQSGDWVEFVTKLYDVGDTFDDITGGWTMGNIFSSSTKNGTGSFNADHVYLNNVGYASIGIYSNNAIDLTPYSRLHAKISGSLMRVSVAASYPTTDFTAYGDNGTSEDFFIDISSLSGFYKIGANCMGVNEHYIYEIWLT